MPDENRFSGLGDVVEEEGAAEAADESAAEPDLEAADAEATANGPDDRASTAGGPAFEFEETTAKSVYVRPETLSVMDDAEFEVESLLRRDHDVRDLTGREFHDAVVRVAAEHPEEVVEVVLAARDGDDADRD